MATFFRLFILSATFLGAANVASAQSELPPVRDSVVINKGGYAVIDKTPTAAEADFAIKSKIVRDAYRKREIRKQQDERSLPAPSVAVDKSNGPLR